MASKTDSKGGTVRGSAHFFDVQYNLPYRDGAFVSFPRRYGKDAFLAELKAMEPTVRVAQHPSPGVNIAYYGIRVGVGSEEAALGLVLDLAERAWKWAERPEDPAPEGLNDGE